MTQPQIIGAVGIGGTVYTAGMEEALTEAAKAAKVDLSDARFEGILAGYDKPAPAEKAPATKAK